jgi:hypothetical protein
MLFVAGSSPIIRDHIEDGSDGAVRHRRCWQRTGRRRRGHDGREESSQRRAHRALLRSRGRMHALGHDPQQGAAARGQGPARSASQSAFARVSRGFTTHLSAIAGVGQQGRGISGGEPTALLRAQSRADLLRRGAVRRSAHLRGAARVGQALPHRREAKL